MRTAWKIGIGLGLAVVLAVGVRMAAFPQPKPAAPTPAALPTKPPILAPAPTPPRAMDASVPSTAPAGPKKAAVPKRKLLSESELLERLRKAQDTDDYMLSYELGREGERRFPKSENAPEFAAMAIKSLARQGKLSEARAEAEVMVNKYAGTHWAREVERHTGAHPTRNQVPPK